MAGALLELRAWLLESSFAILYVPSPCAPFRSRAADVDVIRAARAGPVSNGRRFEPSLAPLDQRPMRCCSCCLRCNGGPRRLAASPHPQE